MHGAVLSSSDDFASLGWREGTAARQESHTEALCPKRKQTYYSEFASGTDYTGGGGGAVSKNNSDHDASSQNPVPSFPDVLLRPDSRF